MEMMGLLEHFSDERDYIAEHMLGTTGVLKEQVDLLNESKLSVLNQGNTMHCSAYALTMVHSILNKLQFNPEEQWINQQKSGASETNGDTLRNALNSIIREGGLTYEYPTGNKFPALSYAMVNKENYKQYLSDGFPIFTGVDSTANWQSTAFTGYMEFTGGSGGHAISLIGYDSDGYIAVNSWGNKWGKQGNGKFKIRFEDIGKLFSGYILYDNLNDNMDNPFKDITSASWAFEAVKLLKEKGIVKGYDDGTFRPENPITRAEMAQMIYNLYILINSK